MGVLLSLSAALLYSIRGVLTKTLNKEHQPFSLIGLTRTLSALPILLFLIISGRDLSITLSPHVIGLFVVLTVIGTIANYTMIKSLETVPFAIYNSVSNVGLAFTALFSALFLREYPTPLESLMLVFIIAICMALSAKELSIKTVISSIVKNPGFRYVLLTQVIFSLSGIGFGHWTHIDDPATITMYMSFSFGISALIIAMVKEQSLVKIIAHTNAKVVLLSLVTGFAFFLALCSKQIVQVTVSDTLISTSILFSILLGHLLFDEKYSKATYVQMFGLVTAIVVFTLV